MIAVNHLPLFYYPTTWLCIDDDKLLNITISNALNRFSQVKCFESSLSCIQYLENYKPFLETQSFLNINTSDEKYGTTGYSCVDLSLISLVGLADNPDRYSEITAMIVDYNMAEMNGLELAKSCRSFPFFKLLLTGEDKPFEAIRGFNDNIIHCFVQKGDKSIFENLTSNLKKLTYKYFQEKTLPLLSHLEAEAPIALTDSTFIDFFEKFCNENDITEYYLLDKQGSFLCIRSDRKKICLIVHSDDSLNEWLKLYENESDDIATVLRPIKERTKIPFFGIGVEGWEIPGSQLQQHYYEPNVLEGRNRYFWTSVNL